METRLRQNVFLRQTLSCGIVGPSLVSWPSLPSFFNSIEVKPKRSGHVLWHQIYRRYRHMGEVPDEACVKPFLVVYIQNPQARSFAKQVSVQLVQFILTYCYTHVNSHIVKRIFAIKRWQFVCSHCTTLKHTQNAPQCYK